MLDLLANLASHPAIPTNLAFRRVFQLLAACLFLPGLAGISEPCENGAVRVHHSMTKSQQSTFNEIFSYIFLNLCSICTCCCKTAQKLVIVLAAQDGYNYVLGVKDKTFIECEIAVEDSVFVIYN